MERRLRETLKAGKFGEVSAVQSSRMRAIKGRDNRSTERAFRMALVRGGIAGWRLHDSCVTGCPDFYFPTSRVAVFVDGCFWHGCKRCAHRITKRVKYWHTKIQGNRQRDAATTGQLAQSGVTVLRFWEHELWADVEGCVVAVRRSTGQMYRGRIAEKSCRVTAGCKRRKR